MQEEKIKSIADLLYAAADEYGDKIYLRQKVGKEIAEKTFRAFGEDAGKVASFLKKAGCGEKVHAGFAGTTSIAYLTCLMGTFISGGVGVPIDPQLSPAELMDNLNRADVSVFFYDPAFAPLLDTMKQVCPGIKQYVSLAKKADEFACEDILANEQPAAPVGIAQTDLACILFTSGTTGKSKGVMLSHGNMIDNVFCCDNESNGDSVLLSVLPIHHAYCLDCDILLSLRYGAQLCINDSIMHVVQNIRFFGVTTILLVPLIVETMYRKIDAMHRMKPDVPMTELKTAVFGDKLRVIFCGGAFLAPKITEAYKEMGIPVLQGYGMTETSPRITSSSLNDPTTGVDVGRVVKRCQVKIVDGEVLVKSPSVMMGYYHDEERTKEMFTEDGWLKTGDLGYVKDERIYLTGRKKNLIILSNGENVSPEELENYFAGEEWAAEVMVYSEEEQITVEVYPFPEYADQAETLFRRKVEEINASVPSARKILRLRLRDTEFSKTTSKKIKRQQPGEKGKLLPAK